MKRMNLREVPDEVYATLVAGAAAHHQSLNAFVVDRLGELAQVFRAADYVASYEPPSGTGVTLEDAVAAVREAREVS
jgi:plasmid stability protein